MIEPIPPTAGASSILPTIPTPSSILAPPNPKFIISAFGLGLLKPKFYKVGVNKDEIEADKNGGLNSSYNLFGLPTFDTLVLGKASIGEDSTVEGTKYEQTIKINGKYVVQKPEIPQMVFSTVLIDVSQSKNIISTPISGGNGTVKEYISDGDYMINIKGVLVGEGINVEPKVLKDNLISFCKAPIPLDVSSDLLLSFGIKSLVIKDYNFAQLEGQKNVVPFELICLSDTPFEVTQSNA